MKRNIINGDIRNIDGMSLNKNYLNQTGITDFMPSCNSCGVCSGSLFGGSTGTIDGGLMPAGSGVLAPTQDIANNSSCVPFSLQPPTDSNNPFDTFEQNLGLAPATSTDQNVFQTECQANTEYNAANCAASSCSASGVGKALSSLGGAAAGAATQIGKTLGLNSTSPTNPANGSKNGSGNTTANALLVPALIGGAVLILVVVMLSVSLSGSRGNVNSSSKK